MNDIVFVPAKGNVNLDALKEHLRGKTTCLAGQSGVGKTSLLNALSPQIKAVTGEISLRIGRGKQTTRQSQIFPVEGGFLVDTAGFSLLEIDFVVSYDLMLYYADFAEYAKECKYHMCMHLCEPSCAVKRAVSEKKICPERYERYVELHSELKEMEKKQY